MCDHGFDAYIGDSRWGPQVDGGEIAEFQGTKGGWFFRPTPI